MEVSPEVIQTGEIVFGQTIPLENITEYALVDEFGKIISEWMPMPK